MGSENARVRLEDVVGTSKRSDVDELVQLTMSGVKYLVLGEYHSDNCIKNLLEKLIEHGSFSSLFLEALARGDYAKDGSALKGSNCVYSQNPRKYNSIIRTAVNHGVNVYGLEAGEARNEKDGKVYAEWAKYVKENRRGRCIILIGADHVDYWKGHTDDSQNFVSKLIGLGVSIKSVVTVSSFPIKVIPQTGAGPKLLYSVKRLPKNVQVPEIDNYFRINSNSLENKEDIDEIDSHSMPTFNGKRKKKGTMSLLMPKFRYLTRTVYIPAFINGKEIVDYIYTINKRIKRRSKIDIE
ncbi:MAG: hypothetical protein M1348_01325 [Candidatus Parvarchaeota archaeon]|nr:hypothetical protein [Candidatus Parvarchaeota archaeon]